MGSWWNGRAAAWLVSSAIAGVLASGCRGTPPVLTRLVDVRQHASNAHVEFAKAMEAANRAVMSDSDERSAEAAQEARRARHEVERSVAALDPMLLSLGYREDLRLFEEFKRRFDEYRRLDDEILGLAVENTNVKAQRLSFGAATETAAAFQKAVEKLADAAAPSETCRVEALGQRAIAALRQVQVLHAPHIAESDLPAMDRMEGEMTRAEATARQSLEQIGKRVPGAATQVDAARAALDRFDDVNLEIVKLSRRNSDVNSLALSLGRKRELAAACEDELRALEEALATHRFGGTR